MPQPNKIPLAFASSGDKNAIPENTETTGLASWREGFPAITSAPFSEGGIAPKRADFNGIFNALSQAVMWMQQGGVYAYDVNTDYEAGNVVLDAGGLYVANAGNGPSSAVVQPSTDTTGAAWKLVRLDLATPTAAGYMSGADKAKLDGLISTDATPSAAGYMSATDKAALDSIPTTYLPKSTISTGTWTPVLAGGTTAGAFVYGSNTAGQYIKIGSLVYVHGYIEISSFTTYPTGSVIVKGLPYIAGRRSMLFNIRGDGVSVNNSFFRFVGASSEYNESYITLRVNNAHQSATDQGLVFYANWFQGGTDYYAVEYSSGNANITIDGLYVAL